MSSKWFIVPKRIQYPRLRLICLPHAGAGASAYTAWAQFFMPAMVELVVVQYPGRENRIREPVATSVEELVSGIADACVPLIDGVPYALIGHSMGALLAYECHRRG